MALIEKNFSRNMTEKVNMIQKATRFLHRICNEAKIAGNVSISRHVPLVKKCLENLIFRVTAMLRANNSLCVGNTEDQNIKGEEILRQTQDSDEEEEDEEEGENEEEEEDDVYADNQSKQDNEHAFRIDDISMEI